MSMVWCTGRYLCSVVLWWYGGGMVLCGGYGMWLWCGTSQVSFQPEGTHAGPLWSAGSRGGTPTQTAAKRTKFRPLLSARNLPTKNATKTQPGTVRMQNCETFSWKEICDLWVPDIVQRIIIQNDTGLKPFQYNWYSNEEIQFRHPGSISATF